MIRIHTAIICQIALLLMATMGESGKSQESTFKISGTIIDKHGQGIEDVQILSFFSRDSNYTSIEAKSDANGGFEIEGPANGSGIFQVLVYKEGFLCEYAESYERERKPFVMQLEPEVPIAVELVDNQGNPIQGATIAPHKVDFDAEFVIETIDYRTSKRLGLCSVTDAQGKALLRGVKHKKLWAIRVDVPGHATVYYQLPHDQTEAKRTGSFQLVWKSHTTKIKCTVKEADGRPAVDTYLRFHSKEEDSNALVEKSATPYTNIMRKLDANGQLELELSSSDVEISSFSYTRGIERKFGSFSLKNGESQNLEFELPATCHVLANVLDRSNPDAKPREGIKVSMRRKVGNEFQFATGITNEDGIAEIEVASGEWESTTIEGNLPTDYVVDPISFKVNAETTTAFAPLITLSKGRTIQGRITGVDCRALRFDFIICTYQTDLSEKYVQGRIQADGTFTIVLPPGIEDSQITNFQITHSPAANLRSLAIMSRKTWSLAWTPDEVFGIGVSLEKQDGKIRIAQVLPNSPASRFAQIVPGVELLSVADEDHPKTDLANSTIEAAVDLIRGSVGSQVTLEIVPIGKGPEDAISITLRRATIPVD